MEQDKSIRVKAGFLLTVFAFNTVIAFACSLGLDMGYNKKHHLSESEKQAGLIPSHKHAPGTKAHHHNTPPKHSHNNTPKHSHKSNHSHGDNAAGSHQLEKSSSNDDDCCTDTAIKFQSEDKKLQQSQNVAIKAPVFIAFLSAFLGFDFAPEKIIAGAKFITPQFHPPPDIRIAIQSFLI